MKNLSRLNGMLRMREASIVNMQVLLTNTVIGSGRNIDVMPLGGGIFRNKTASVVSLDVETAFHVVSPWCLGS